MRCFGLINMMFCIQLINRTDRQGCRHRQHDTDRPGNTAARKNGKQRDQWA